MKQSWPEAIAFTFNAEGYHSASSWDPGGDTILGISRTFFPREHDLISQMTRADAQAYAEAFYHVHFWTPMGCDDMTHPFDVVCFDSSVNPGPSWMKGILATGVKDWRNVLTLREQHYEARAAEEKAKGQPYPLQGLLNRCTALREKYANT